jgi:hypothetical protein
MEIPFTVTRLNKAGEPTSIQFEVERLSVQTDEEGAFDFGRCEITFYFATEDQPSSMAVRVISEEPEEKDTTETYIDNPFAHDYEDIPF